LVPYSLLNVKHSLNKVSHPNDARIGFKRKPTYPPDLFVYSAPQILHTHAPISGEAVASTTKAFYSWQVIAVAALFGFVKKLETFSYEFR